MKTLRLLAAAALAASLVACGAGQVDGADAAADSSDEVSITPQFQLFQGKDGQFYFHLLAANGQKVLGSEGYTTQSAARNGISSVMTNGVDASRYQLRTAVDGSPYFVLKARNGATIGVSQLYSSASAAQSAISTVQGIITAGPEIVGAPSGAGFTLFKGLDGKYYFHLKAANGEIVLQSQGYTTKTGAQNGEASVQTNGTNAARYQVREADDGDAYFVLKAGNGQVIGLSEMYESESAAQTGAGAVQALLGAGK